MGWQKRFVVGWSGMRGAVSLAAALALPLETDAGAPLPERDLILFITFALIFVTVVGQGLTSRADPPAGVVEDGPRKRRRSSRARLFASRAALDRLDQLEGEEWTNNDSVERARGIYRFRQRRFKTRAGKIDDDGIEDQSLAWQRMMHDVYTRQRQELIPCATGADLQRRHAPHRARAGPGGVPARGLSEIAAGRRNSVPSMAAALALIAAAIFALGTVLSSARR